MIKKIVAVTGHRPDKLYGYNMSDKRYMNMKKYFKSYLKENNVSVAVSGMALGVDQIFAIATLELKEEGFPIELYCAIPFKGQEKKWPEQSKKQYKDILEKANTIHYVSNDTYKAYLLQKRNEHMVDISDEILAIWDGSSSGTKNCIDYAQKKNKKITIKNPKEF